MNAPWRIEKRYIDDTWHIEVIVDADGEDIDTNEYLETVVAAVNFYTALPEDVRKLSPETVRLCVEAIRHRKNFTIAQFKAMQAAEDALEAEAKN